MEALSTLSAPLIKAPISFSLNLLLANIKKLKSFNPPIAQQLWKKFYEAFYDSFTLVSNSKLEYSEEQIKISNLIKVEIQRYIGDSNYFPLIQIFQKFSGENFENFLYKLQADENDILKAEISEVLYEKLNLQIRIQIYNKSLIVETLITVLGKYNDSFLSILNEKDGQRVIIEEIFNTQQKLEDFNKSCLDFLTVLIENSPDKLDSNLLSKISAKNLIQYFNKEFSCLGQIIDRTEEELLFDSIEKSFHPLIFLAGNSGVGKSLLCFKLLQHLAESNIVLWIDAKNIEASNSLQQSIHLQIQEIKSNTNFDYTDFDKILDHKRLFIVIDDINRINNSSEIARKLLSWRFQSEQIQLPTFSIICPIWESNYQSFINQNPQAKSKSQRFQLSLFDEADADLLIRKNLRLKNIYLSESEVSQIAKNLNYDPFLIGLFGDLIAMDSSGILHLSKTPLNQFLNKHIDRIAQNSDFLVFEINKELNDLASFMLQNKHLNLNWKDLSIYNSNSVNSREILRLIGKDGNIFKINDSNGDIQFRHDRIRDILLINQLSVWIKDEKIIDSIFKEVYFDNLLSQSILEIEVSDKILSYFIEENPTVLFESIKHLGNFSDAYRIKIVQYLKNWLAYKKEYSILENEINSIFIRTTSPIVIEVTEEIKVRKNKDVLLARFANGDISSALQYFSLLDSKDTVFLPLSKQYKYLSFEQSIETAQLHYAQDCLQKITEILSGNNLSSDYQRFLIQLIGLFDFSNLGESAFALWKKSPYKEDLLSSIIWTLLICYRIKHSKYLKKILRYWEEVMQKGTDLENSDIHKYLRFSYIWKNLSDDAIEEILSWIDLGANTKKLAIDILKFIDNPKVVNGLLKEENFQNEAFRDIESYREPKWIRSRYTWLNISEASKIRDADLSRKCLILYIKSSQKNDLAHLKKILFDYYKVDDIIFNMITWRRLKLNDVYL